MYLTYVQAIIYSKRIVELISRLELMSFGVAYKRGHGA